jgi:hypothetical protein
MIRLNQFLKISLMFSGLFLLLGCKHQSSYLYLIQHPETLQSELAKCRNTDSADTCKIAKRAAQDLVIFNNQRQDNPEKFGLKILQAQQTLAKTHDNLTLAQNDLLTHANDAAVQKKVVSLKDDYNNQLEQVNAMLAIVATTSPE